MKKLKLFVTAIILALAVTFSLQPLKTNNNTYTQSIDYATGYIPIENTDFDENFVTKVDAGILTSNEIPASYSLSDDITIQIENQDIYNICYSFASLTMLETHLALTKGVNYDFSEIHFASSVYIEDGITGDGNVDFDFGGNFYNFYSYLMKGAGPVLESDMPWDDFHTSIASQITSKEAEAESYYIENNDKFTHPVTVEQLVSFPDASTLSNTDKATNRQNIKYHIMNYGSLIASIDSTHNTSNLFTTSGGKYFLMPSADSSSDHMISIIGWDDSISVTISGVTYTGAWICANSWGTSWGNGGYFYAPYGINYIENSVYGVTASSLNEKSISNVENLSKWSTSFYNFEGLSYDITFANVIDLESQTNEMISSINLGLYVSNGYKNVRLKFFDSLPTTSNMKSMMSESSTLLSFNSNLDNMKISSYYIPINEYLPTLTLSSPIKITGRYAIIIVECDDLYAFQTFEPTSQTTSSNILENTYNYSSNFSQSELLSCSYCLPIRLNLQTNYSISYELDNGINNSNNKDSFNSTTTQLKLYEPTKEGFTFKGWYTSADFDENTKLINSSNDVNETYYLYEISSYSNLTFYAEWEINSYSITYILNEGENNSENPNNYTYADSQIKLYIPTRDAEYEFAGWYLDSNFEKSLIKENDYYIYNISEYKDITFYAKWESTVQLKQYTITYYDANATGGQNSTSNKTSFDETISTLQLYSPTSYKDGFTFTGWYKDKELTDKLNYDYTNNYYYYEINSYTDLSFYAGWQIASINITSQPTNINTTYNNSSHNLTVTATHPTSTATGTALSYSWEYKATETDDFATLQNSNSNVLSLKNVADSGYYRCLISFNYENFSTTIYSNDVTVIINKADYLLSWDYSNALKYNGKEQTIHLVNEDKYPNLIVILNENSKTNAGKYTAQATFVNNDNNYNTPTLPSLNWEIKPQEIEILIKESTVYSESEFNNFTNVNYVFLGEFYDDYNTTINPTFKFTSMGEHVKLIELDNYLKNSNYIVSSTTAFLKYVRSEIPVYVKGRDFIIYNSNGFVVDAEFNVTFKEKNDIPENCQTEIEKKDLNVYDYFNLEITDENLTEASEITFEINSNLKDKNIKVYQITDNGLVEIKFTQEKDMLKFITSTYGEFIVVEAPETVDMKTVLISLAIILGCCLFVCLVITGIKHKRNKKYAHDKHDTIIYH